MMRWMRSSESPALTSSIQPHLQVNVPLSSRMLSMHKWLLGESIQSSAGTIQHYRSRRRCVAMTPWQIRDETVVGAGVGLSNEVL